MVAELRDPKRYYYAMSNKYAREMKQIGQKMMFAMSEEEDAQQWEKFKKVRKRWLALKAPEGVKVNEKKEPWPEWRLKPVFDEAYVELTRQMKREYAKKATAKTEEERETIDETVIALQKKRDMAATFMDRETGEKILFF